MEKNVMPVAPVAANTKPFTGSRWTRELIQLTGKSGHGYIHGASRLLKQSYAEIGAIPHGYHVWESPCTTDIRKFGVSSMLRALYYGSAPHNADILLNPLAVPHMQSSLSTFGVSALEFDTMGTYLISVTRSGCLTLHLYESLYNHFNKLDQWEDEKQPLWHVVLDEDINVVRWNPSGQEELAYTSLRNCELTIFDLLYSEAIQVLRTSSRASVLVSEGLSDVAFSNDGTRVLASSTRGEINMWDRRVNDLPQIALTSETNIGLTSIQLLEEHQIVCGASKSGYIYTWDLRGGRLSDSIRSDTEVNYSPISSVNLESMLSSSSNYSIEKNASNLSIKGNKKRPLKAQANIQQREIQSISINPSCTYQLGFHLDDGCSGVLDMHNSRVSHIHCPPPPPWLSNLLIPVLPPRNPSWLRDQSIYAAASTSSNGVHLLDFYRHHSSPCHVDYDDSKSPRESDKHKQSVFVPLSERATACATHPFDDIIVAGTMEASLLWISSKHLCKKEDGDDDDDDDK